ncbi:PREDICTED: 26S protease regulatory subunit 6A [Drosophila arizonae]|uniref:26S protease regulatory subunit 6A n=1 Tax=Drosophila arizonae TaxID=7263 RepID=A0ABM1Q326_DROAR|nr:PREDICTED: 26S protease regulatory subunit 6A [Drosophila arizonae]
MAQTLEDKSIWEDGEESLGEEVLRMSTDEIVSRTRLMDNEIKIMKSEVMRITHEIQAQNEKIKDNTEKIKVNKTLPYLVSNVIELLDVDPQEEEDDGSVTVLDNQRKGKCAVIKTSTRQAYFLPVIGLVDAEKLKPGDLVGVNKDSYLILETLPAEYDARVKAMEVDERPTEQYSDIGGLDKQIQELIEAVVLPMTHKENDREVQRTMLELLNQLDGFSSTADIKVIAATNRVDILDPALLRSGRLDRKIEFPHPNEEARARIMQIHSRKMNVSNDVNFEELSRSTDDFNGAQCKAVCVEAGMIALRRSATSVTHEDFMDAIMEVQSKKKANLNYYA